MRYKILDHGDDVFTVFDTKDNVDISIPCDIEIAESICKLFNVMENVFNDNENENENDNS